MEVEYLLARADTFAQSVQPTDQETQQYYEEHKSGFASETGQPLSIRPSFWLGSISYSGGSGSAHMNLVISGSSGTSFAFIDLECAADQWKIAKVFFRASKDAKVIEIGVPINQQSKTDNH